jgi:hypothetical protein
MPTQCLRFHKVSSELFATENDANNNRSILHPDVADFYRAP